MGYTDRNCTLQKLSTVVIVKVRKEASRQILKANTAAHGVVTQGTDIRQVDNPRSQIYSWWVSLREVKGSTVRAVRRGCQKEKCTCKQRSDASKLSRYRKGTMQKRVESNQKAKKG